MKVANSRLLPLLVMLAAACGASPAPSQVPPPAPVVWPAPPVSQPAPESVSSATIDIVAGEVRLDGTVVDRVPQDEVVDLGGLHERLRQLRESLPAEERSLRFLVGGDLNMATVFSVQHTASLSGFWRMSWEMAGRRVEIATTVPNVDFGQQEKHRVFVSLEPGNEEFGELFAIPSKDGQQDPTRFAVRNCEPNPEDGKLIRLVENACRKRPCGGVMLEVPASFPFEIVEPIILAAVGDTGGPLLLSRVKPDGAKETSMKMLGEESRPPGRLPASAIQDIVRASYGRFLKCYQQGIARDPRLHGSVSVRFLIAEDGSVETVSRAGGNLADEDVVACILDVFSGLRFPEPEGGVVSVVYPIAFDA